VVEVRTSARLICSVVSGSNYTLLQTAKQGIRTASERELMRPEGLLNAALAHKAQVLPMLLITAGVSTLLMTLGHAHLQGHEPVAERVVTPTNTNT